MAIRKVFVKGEEILTKHCKPVREITPRVRELCNDMIDTMRDQDGVGLAAPQVGVMKRIFVAIPDREDEDNVYVMINPEILEKSGEQECVEGCLSVPGYVGHVKRPMTVRVKALDIDGNEQEYEFSGFGANVICHEYDHLEGILYTDIARDVMTNEEYDKLLKEKEEDLKRKMSVKGGMSV
ncbi:MAG: peptide deformylase [Mogibacterium sp.]|nr:peptide deformylase [Mogibacterium sp.]